MNNDYLNQQQETSNSGYAPNIQITTGTYSVAVVISQSSNKLYCECFDPEYEEVFLQQDQIRFCGS